MKIIYYVRIYSFYFMNENEIKAEIFSIGYV